MKYVNKYFPLIVILVTVVVYRETFAGVFVFDDYIWIVDNENIRSFWSSILYSSRPLIGFTFFINYLFGGLKAADYHAVNLLIHLSSTMLLYGILRTTFEFPRFRDWIGANSVLFAGVISLIWGVHPLQTESVTYIVQRSESLMGMFYLLTMYCFVKGLTLQNGVGRWFLFGIISCSLGLLCKPVMITAPLLVILYDRTFISGSLIDAFRRHKDEYILLLGTLLIPVCLLTVPNESSTSAGFGSIAVGPLQYLATQAGVLIHYIKVTLWPVNLCLDYDWSPAVFSSKVVVEFIIMALLEMFSIYLFLKHRATGFIALAFFIMLFPSSGVIPLSDCAAEHRMYLPSICIILLLFMGLMILVQSILGRGFGAVVLLLIIGTAVCICLGVVTIRRNKLYLAEDCIWRDVITNYPNNLRGYLGLGTVLLRNGDLERAEQYFVRIVKDPRATDANLGRKYGTEFGMAYNNLGVIAFQKQQFDKAKVFFQKALSFADIITARNNLKLISLLEVQNGAKQ